MVAPTRSRCVVSHSAFRMEFDPVSLLGIAMLSSVTAGCSLVPVCPQCDKGKTMLCGNRLPWHEVKSGSSPEQELSIQNCIQISPVIY